MRLGWSLGLVLAALASLPAARPQDPPATSATPSLTLAEKEEFLHNAKIVSQHNLSQGVTNSRRATLDDGKMQHDAHIQTVNISKQSFQTSHGTELNFRDTYKYNVAGYELAKLLALDMVPPSVERKVGGTSSAVTWWVDNKQFDELDRVKQNVQPPNLDSWNKQMYVVRVFDQLVYNTDRNLGNLVIDKSWNIWMIDHTRAFRTSKNLENVKNLVQCDRNLLAKMRGLDKEQLKEHLGSCLTGSEIDALLARRDKIVKFFDGEIAKKGEGAVLYDLASVRK
ncbi:MAG TPA: hypothetical protein VEU62_17560 [Bryobacterales bacterium]|nr:hypothetical protein [Bryobacterales bacterium]